MDFAAGYWPYSGMWLYSFPNGAWLAIAAAVLLVVAAVHTYREQEYVLSSVAVLVAAGMLATSIVTVVYTNRTLAVNLSTLDYGVFPYEPASWTVPAAAIMLCVLLVLFAVGALGRNVIVSVVYFLALPADTALLLQGKLMLSLNDQAALLVTYAWLAEAAFVAVVAIVWLAVGVRKRRLAQEVTD